MVKGIYEVDCPRVSWRRRYNLSGARLLVSQLKKGVQLVFGQAAGNVLLVASTDIFFCSYRFAHSMYSTVLSLSTLSVKSFQINFLLIESHWLLSLKMLFQLKERSSLLNIFVTIVKLLGKRNNSPQGYTNVHLGVLTLNFDMTTVVAFLTEEKISQNI